MTSDKKADELRWLERFRAASGLEFEVDDPRQEREAPDFLVGFQGRAVGVESAKLQLDQDAASKKGSALQESLSLRNRIVERAEKWYFDEANSPINATICFGNTPPLEDLGIYRDEIARSLVESLRQLGLEYHEQRRLDRCSAPPVRPPISFLYARGLPAGIQPRWQVVDAGWSGAIRPCQVAPLLEEKNARLERYRQVAEENWLLIVADRLHSPGRFRPPEQHQLELPQAVFFALSFFVRQDHMRSSSTGVTADVAGCPIMHDVALHSRPAKRSPAPLDDIKSGCLMITMRMQNRRRFGKGTDPRARFLSYLSQPGRLWLYLPTCVAIAGAVYGGVLQAIDWLFFAGLSATLVLYQIVNFHHYIVDAPIWKTRRPVPLRTPVHAN